MRWDYELDLLLDKAWMGDLAEGELEAYFAKRDGPPAESTIEKSSIVHRESPMNGYTFEEHEPLISSHPEVMSGEPCIHGTRIPALACWRYWRGGYSVALIAREYPSLSVDQIKAAIRYGEGRHDPYCLHGDKLRAEREVEHAPVRDAEAGLTRDYGSVLLRVMEQPRPTTGGLPNGVVDLTDDEKRQLQRTCWATPSPVR